MTSTHILQSVQVKKCETFFTKHTPRRALEISNRISMKILQVDIFVRNVEFSPWKNGA